MAVDLQTLTPDTSLPTDGFLFGADSQSVGTTSPSVYSTQTVATTLLGSTALTTQTVTVSSPLLNLAQTWNAGAVAFTGLKFNATDTASASSSLLADLQVGAASKFAIRKDGQVTINYGVSVAAIFAVGNGDGLNASVSGSDICSYGPYGVRLRSGVNISFGSGSDGRSSADTTLSRAAPASLQLGSADAAAPVAQTLQVQSVVAGTSNTAGVNWTLKGSAGTGTGAGGSIIFQTAPAGSSGTAQNAYATALTLDASKNAIFAGPIFGSASGVFDSAGVYYRMDSNGVAIATGASFGLAASNTSAPDTKMFRDSAAVLRLENCLLLKGITFASLPASPVAGTIAKITDSTVTTGQIAGGGANTVLAYYKASATAGWYVLAAL